VTSDDAVEIVIEAIEHAGIPYMIVGSLSSNFHGIPRSTKDADFVLQLHSRSVAEIAPLLGPEFYLDPQTTFEMATMSSRNIIKIADMPFIIELFHLTDDAHDLQRFERRVRGLFGSKDAWVASAEDVVITKLNWSLRLNRRKDIDDVRDVIAVQQSNLDWPYIESWCDKHGTRALLDQIRTSVAGL
jgi:hypothetical protein